MDSLRKNKRSNVRRRLIKRTNKDSKQRIRQIRLRKRFVRRRPNRKNLYAKKRDKYENKKLQNEIKELTTTMAKMNLGGGPIKNPRKSLIKKEIRNDRVYSAMSLYLRNQNMSLYDSNQKVVYFNNYNAYTCSVANNNFYMLWYPYFYPCTDPTRMRMTYDSTNVGINACSNLLYGYGENITTLYECNQIKVYGMQRLVCATMKISNITPNTNKGGAYTIYRLTNNFGTPLIYNNSVAFDTKVDTQDISSNNDIINGKYSNSSVKYLFGGNEIGIIDEYNVTQGNTMFCNWQEYLGNRITDRGSDFLEIHNSVGGWAEKNAIGVNIKYLIHFDPITVNQTYKIETWSLFEVVPPQDSFLASTATLPAHIATKSVIDDIKMRFPIHKGF